MNLITDEIAATIGKLWERGSMRRYYISADRVRELIGLDVSRYGSGNVSGATLNGERISNSKGSSYYGSATYDKFYIENGVVRSSCYSHVLDLLVEAVEKLVNSTETI